MNFGGAWQKRKAPSNTTRKISNINLFSSLYDRKLPKTLTVHVHNRSYMSSSYVVVSLQYCVHLLLEGNNIEDPNGVLDPFLALCACCQPCDRESFNENSWKKFDVAHCRWHIWEVNYHQVVNSLITINYNLILS